MQTSKCPHCQKIGLEAVLENVRDYSFTLAVIRCQWCKTIVSILDQKNVGAMVSEISNTQKEVATQITMLSKKVEQVSLKVDNLANQIVNLSLKVQ